MELFFKEISKTDYNELKCPILFVNKLGDVCFGYLSNNEFCYKFAWQSTLIKPLIIQIHKNIYSIGIDLNFVILDYIGSIKLNLPLSYYFYDVKLHNDWIYLITQLEIIKINSQTFEVMQKYGLPEFFEEIYFKGDDVEVKCLDGQVIKLKDE